jgi:hypothetical protein
MNSATPAERTEGFRHYRTIIETLLHELAHMVHSEHEAPFHALNRQLNIEYVKLDWKKSEGTVRFPLYQRTPPSNQW